MNRPDYRNFSHPGMTANLSMNSYPHFWLVTFRLLPMQTLCTNPDQPLSEQSQGLCLNGRMNPPPSGREAHN